MLTHIFPADYKFLIPELGLITASAWKGNVIVLGYGDGSLSLMNTKNSEQINTKLTGMGRIESLKFASGKGNTLLLVNSQKELAVWDVREMSQLSRVKKALLSIYFKVIV